MSTPPVNAILSTRGSVTSVAAGGRAVAGDDVDDPGGQVERLARISASISADSGVCSAGLSTAVQPAASAGASFHAAISSG